MSYIEFARSEVEKIGGGDVVKLIKDIRGSKALVYMHDDPDGLAAGAIVKRLLEKNEVECSFRIPPYMELGEREIKAASEKEKFSAVFVLDKATMGYYDDYLSFVPDIAVIDHHPVTGKKPEKIIVANPQMQGGYRGCSASYVAHMIASVMGTADIYDDFLALLGLKGDWAVEPATDYVSDYVEDFYREKSKGPLSGLLKKIKSEATMFEVNQREYTTLLSRITELYFALGGGGFQYFYNERDERIAPVNQPEFSFRLLCEGEKSFAPRRWNNLADYIESTGQKDKVNLIYKYFKEDWSRAINSFSESRFICRLGNTDIFIFEGKDVPLMPMAGSVFLKNLKKEPSSEVLFVMVNRQSGGGIHFSARATSGDIHAGKLCSNMAERLREKFGMEEEITGGGHFVAAECKTRRAPVPYRAAMDIFYGLIEDMKEADRKKSNLAPGLGLEYISS